MSSTDTNGGPQVSLIMMFKAYLEKFVLHEKIYRHVHPKRRDDYLLVTNGRSHVSLIKVMTYCGKVKVILQIEKSFKQGRGLYVIHGRKCETNLICIKFFSGTGQGQILLQHYYFI